MAESTTSASFDGQTANVALDKYTMSLMVIFIFQLIFCFGICCYTNMKI